ncbi:hypothetical protein [Leptospira ryugenii]|uniref:hypothetical protein n=1 Tax=Leptospira ryugenii TaxID=1917863 RepID=UPI00107F5247|nr:hypothetical protein [Leptospira ryugenii]
MFGGLIGRATGLWNGDRNEELNLSGNSLDSESSGLNAKNLSESDREILKTIIEKQRSGNLNDHEKMFLRWYKEYQIESKGGFVDKNGALHVIGTRNNLTLGEMVIAANLKPGQIYFEQATFSFVGAVGISASYTKFIDSDGFISHRTDIQPAFGYGVGSTLTFGFVQANGLGASDVNFDGGLSYGIGPFGGTNNFQQAANPSYGPNVDLVEKFMPASAFIGITASGTIIPWKKDDLPRKDIKPSKRDRMFIERMRTDRK